MATSIDWFQGAVQQIKDISKPPMTKQEAMKYFQQRNPKNWNRELSEKLQPLLPLSKSGEMQSIPNIERRHQARKGKGIPGMTAQTAAQYRELGLSIGYQPPKNGYHINCVCWIKFSETCAKRTIDVDIVGEWATELTASPALFQRAMLLLYMEEDQQDKEIDEQQPSVGLCESGDSGEDGESVHDPDISITANEKETHSGHSGQRRRFSFFS